MSQILAMVKAEIGDYSGSNSAADAALMVQISNKQKWLATEYDWPFLERRWDLSVPANAQYSTFPVQNDLGITADINWERFPKVEVFWDQVYQPVLYGIGAEEYNMLNYALLQQSDPIQRWRAASNPDEPSDPNQFEVWPVPVTPQILRFTGQRALLPLVQPTDTADLDDMLLVYYVAAERLFRLKQQDANEKMQLAVRRLQWVRQNYPVRDVYRSLCDGDMAEWRRERRLVGITIAVAGAAVPPAPPVPPSAPKFTADRTDITADTTTRTADEQ